MSSSPDKLVSNLPDDTFKYTAQEIININTEILNLMKERHLSL